MNQNKIAELYQLNQDIENLLSDVEDCIDPDTGQVQDEAVLEQITRSIKDATGGKDSGLLELGHSVLAKKTEVKAIIEQEKRFNSRIKILNKLINYESEIIDNLLAPGYKLADGVCSLSRKSVKDVVIDLSTLPAEWMRPKYKDNPNVPDKDGIKAALNEKKKIPGATIEQVYRLQVK